MVTRLQELTGVALAFSRRETILEGMTSSSHAAVAHDPVGPPIPFDNSYARLPEAFYERVRPVQVAAPQLLRLNQALRPETAHRPRIPEKFSGRRHSRGQRHRTGFGAHRA